MKGASPTKWDCRCSHELPKGPHLVPLSDQCLLSQLVFLGGTGQPLVPLLSIRLNFLQICFDAARDHQGQGELTPASSSSEEDNAALPVGRTHCPAAHGPWWVWHSRSSIGTGSPRLSSCGVCVSSQGQGKDSSRFGEKTEVFSVAPSESTDLASEHIHHASSSSPYFRQETTWRQSDLTKFCSDTVAELGQSQPSVPEVKLSTADSP